MKKYKFENHAGEIIDPIIDKLQWTDSFGGSEMPVYAVLSCPQGCKFHVFIGTFEYGETYEDADVMAWALVELENYISLP
jgi:hypothetical protein